jgi:hypothetical protein
MSWKIILKAKRVSVGELEHDDKYYSFDDFELKAEFTENSNWPQGFSRVTTKSKYGSSTKYPSDTEMRDIQDRRRYSGRREGERDSFGSQEFSLMFETKGKVVVIDENNIEIETIPHDKIEVEFMGVKSYDRQNAMPIPIEFEAMVDFDDLPVIYVTMVVG